MVHGCSIADGGASGRKAGKDSVKIGKNRALLLVAFPTSLTANGRAQWHGKEGKEERKEG